MEYDGIAGVAGGVQYANSFPINFDGSFFYESVDRYKFSSRLFEQELVPCGMIHMGMGIDNIFEFKIMVADKREDILHSAAINGNGGFVAIDEIA